MADWIRPRTRFPVSDELHHRPSEVEDPPPRPLQPARRASAKIAHDRREANRETARAAQRRCAVQAKNRADDELRDVARVQHGEHGGSRGDGTRPRDGACGGHASETF